MEDRKHQKETQLPPSYHGASQVVILGIQHNSSFLLQHLIRSLATRGELVPIYQKAKEKAAEAEKRKKEKGKA